MQYPIFNKANRKPVLWKNIELLIFDCDGVLTDGKIVLIGELLESKNFNAHDGLGFMLLKHAGISSAIVTGRNSKALQRRCEELNIPHCLQGIKNKLKACQELIDQLKLKWYQVVYMGDDWNDVPVMQKAAYSVCPADAVSEVQKIADYITVHFAGDGAVRECIDLVLHNKGIYEKAVASFLQDIT